MRSRRPADVTPYHPIPADFLDEILDEIAGRARRVMSERSWLRFSRDVAVQSEIPLAGRSSPNSSGRYGRSVRGSRERLAGHTALGGPDDILLEPRIVGRVLSDGLAQHCAGSRALLDPSVAAITGRVASVLEPAVSGTGRRDIPVLSGYPSARSVRLCVGSPSSPPWPRIVGRYRDGETDLSCVVSSATPAADPVRNRVTGRASTTCNWS